MEEESESNELKSILLEIIPDCKDIDLVVQRLKYYGSLFSIQKKNRPSDSEIKEDCKKLYDICNKADELLSLIDSVKSFHLLAAIEEGLCGYEHILNEKELLKNAAVESAKFHKFLQADKYTTGDIECDEAFRDLFESTNPTDSLKWLEDMTEDLFADHPHLQRFIKKMAQQQRHDRPRLETFAGQLHGFGRALESTEKLFGMTESGEKYKKDARGRATNYDAYAFLDEIGNLLKEMSGEYPGFTDMKNIVSALVDPILDKPTALDGPIQDWTECNK